MAGVPALASITPRLADPARARRAADQALSPLIDASAEGYRVIYAALRDPQGTNPIAFPFVAVTGDEAAIVATVATNLAVTAINDFRSALLIDADPDAGLVAGIVSVPRQPGVADVLAGRSDWAAVTVSASAGRDRTLDVISAGQRGGHRLSGERATPDDAARGELRGELLRLGRRYELIVVAAPPGAPQTGSRGILPVSEALICARVAFTTLSRLASSVSVLQDSGLPRAWHCPVGRGFAAAGPAAAHSHLSSRRPCSLIACCSSNTIFFFASRSGRTFSVLAGALLLLWLARRDERSPLLFHFAVQTAAWGAFAVALAAYQWHGLALRDLAGATDIDHLLWLTLGLDLGGVGRGRDARAHRLAAGPAARAQLVRDSVSLCRLPHFSFWMPDSWPSSRGWCRAGPTSIYRRFHAGQRPRGTNVFHHWGHQSESAVPLPRPSRREMPM